MPNALKYPNPKPAAGGGANAGVGKAAWENARTRARAKRHGKTRERGPRAPLGGGMCDWDCRGQVRASGIALSGTGRCSGRGRACVQDCTATRIDPQRGRPLQWEGTRARRHAACAGGVPFRENFRPPLITIFKNEHVRQVNNLRHETGR